MSTKEISAFPTDLQNGMTLRDYFAGQALAGSLAAESPGFVYSGNEDGSLTREDCAARDAYAMADAMLRARSAKEEEA